MGKRSIITVNEYPPIPIRTHDWCAYWDGDEELGQYGHGATEKEAINALLAEYPMCKNECDHVGLGGECLRCGAESGEVCREEAALTTESTNE